MTFLVCVKEREGDKEVTARPECNLGTLCTTLYFFLYWRDNCFTNVDHSYTVFPRLSRSSQVTRHL